MGHSQLLLQSKADMTNMIICILRAARWWWKATFAWMGGDQSWEEDIAPQIHYTLNYLSNMLDD
jgi:hypothetical protein